MNIYIWGEKGMIVLKYIFLFLIFIGTTSIGNMISKKYRNRVNELKAFKEICNMLNSKIKFTYEPLGEIFEEMSKIFSNEKNISSILQETSKTMRDASFKKSWESSIDKFKNYLNLNNEDINILKGLSNMLGKTDIEGQLNEIDLTMDFLDTQIKEAEVLAERNHRMYRSLGTIVGLVIVILSV